MNDATHRPLAADPAAQRQGWLEDTLVVAALAAVWLAALAWARPLMLPDEGRYVGVAWEMLRSGEWLTPTLNGMPYFHKPPLMAWITAGAMAALGPHAWAARAAPLLGAWLAVLALYVFARRWSSGGIAKRSALVLVMQPMVYLAAQFANLDMLVAGCISATVLGWAHAALRFEQGQPSPAVRDGAYALAALGVLAKGLIGLVLPVLVIVAWLARRRRWSTLRALLSWRGALLFAVLAVPWFVLMQWRYSGFLDYFFIVQHAQRFAGSGFNNVQPFWFFPVVLALLWLPFLPWLRPALAGAFYRDAERGAVRQLMAVWAGVVVLFFSLPESKLVGYVLPSAPPLAYLVADAVAARWGSAPAVWPRRWWGLSVALAAAVGLGVVVALAIEPRRSTRELGEALAQVQRGAEPVYMVQGYYFDLPLYARLQSPVHVVEAWSSPEAQRRDTWRKELLDAQRLAGAPQPSWLIEPGAWPAALCQAPVNWVIGPANAADRHPFLRHDNEVARLRGTTLWRVVTDPGSPAAVLRCPAASTEESSGR